MSAPQRNPTNVSGSFDRGTRKSRKDSEKVIFNPSLNDEKQSAFQRLGKECSSQKEQPGQRAHTSDELGILKGQKACMAGAEGTKGRMVRRGEERLSGETCKTTVMTTETRVVAIKTERHQLNRKYY